MMSEWCWLPCSRCLIGPGPASQQTIERLVPARGPQWLRQRKLNPKRHGHTNFDAAQSVCAVTKIFTSRPCASLVDPAVKARPAPPPYRVAAARSHGSPQHMTCAASTRDRCRAWAVHHSDEKHRIETTMARPARPAAPLRSSGRWRADRTEIPEQRLLPARSTVR